jgi:uridine phosphorylase
LEEAIVKPPLRGAKPPVPPWVVMAATGPDLQRLRRDLDLLEEPGQPLYLSRIYRPPQTAPRYCLVGPFMGAPQAAMLLETLSTWGGQHYLFVGWCGAVAPHVQTGDIILPNGAFVEEGTSRGYGVMEDETALPTESLHDTVKRTLTEGGVQFHEGPVWSTDAVFRETPSKLRAYQARGALAVEMEISACLTVARLRGVRFAAVLVVSDALTEGRWQPGFRDPRFKEACRTASRIVENLCRTA